MFLKRFGEFLNTDVRSEVEWPTGLATLVIFCICLASYYCMSPIYGMFLYPDALMYGPDSINWLGWAIKMGFLGGFWHGSLAHLFHNMLVTIPCMLVIEKMRGPLAMIGLYVLSSVVGMIFLFHMTVGSGIGSSCATFGLAVVATYLLTSGISRLVLLVPIVVMLMEGACWWMGILGDNVAHLGHVGGMVVGFIYILAIKDK